MSDLDVMLLAMTQANPALLSQPDEQDDVAAVVDDLDDLWRVWATRLRAERCVVPARLHTVGPVAECGGDVDTLALLLNIGAPRLVYVHDERLDAAAAWEVHRPGSVNDPESPAEPVPVLSQQLLEQHDGQTYRVEVALLVDGVVHRWIWLARWARDLGLAVRRAEEQAYAQRCEQDALLHGVDEQQQNSFLTGLPDLLLQDETWLRCSSDRAARAYADELADTTLGPGSSYRPGMRGAIAMAVDAARQRRRSEVIPAREARLLANLPSVAEKLGQRGEFTSATTKRDREATARAFLEECDPLVRASRVLAELLRAAQVGIYAGRPRQHPAAPADPDASNDETLVPR
jgi:hypothetical protein